MNVETKTLEDLNEMAQDGIVHGVYNVRDYDYHQFRALNSSSIKAAATSLADFNAIFNPDPNAPIDKRQDHFAFGSAFHAYMLDMEEFNDGFCVKPNGLDMRTTAGKEWKAANVFKHVLSEVDMYKIEMMAKNLRKSEWYKKYTDSDHLTEVAIFWECEITGMQCKAKLDLISEKYGTLDLKSTSKPITDGSLRYAILSFGYHIQQAHYVAGVKSCLPDFSTAFALGWSQKAEPFGCRHTILAKSNNELIDKDYESLMMDIQYGIENNFWPFPGDGQTLEIDLYGK